MKPKPKCRWFVECNARANSQIAEDFAQEVDERLHPKMVCADGEKRDLWEVPSRYIRNKLVVNETECNFDFTVFRSRGSGLPEKAELWLYRKRAERPDKKPKKIPKDKRQLVLALEHQGVDLKIPEHLRDPDSSPFK